MKNSEKQLLKDNKTAISLVNHLMKDMHNIDEKIVKSAIGSLSDLAECFRNPCEK